MIQTQHPTLFPKKFCCSTCPLDKEQLTSPKMPPTGTSEPIIYILGEAPGAEEDKEGKQFVGKAGKLLRRYIPQDLLPHIRWNNTIRCRPPGNRTPISNEIECCRALQVKDIEATKPVAIFGFGLTPLKWAVPSAEEIGSWRGLRIPVRIGNHECWFFPMYHPAFIARKEHDPKIGDALLDVFVRDIRNAVRFLQSEDSFKPAKVVREEELRSGIELQTSWGKEGIAQVKSELEGALERARRNRFLTLDIETNCLRPYIRTPKILTVAVGDFERAFAFCLDHRESKWSPNEREEVLQILKTFLQHSGSIWAHNAKFELEWLLWQYKDPQILYCTRWNDTMAQAYTLRVDIKLNLNDRSAAVLGIGVKALSEVNRADLDSANLKDVLYYNALDVKCTSMLASRQMELLLEEKLLRVYKAQLPKIPSLAWMQSKGWVPDFSRVEEYHAKLTNDINNVLSRIRSNKDVKAYVRSIMGSPFSPSSSTQVAAFFRDFLRREEGWITRGGQRKYSTDEKVLENIPHPVAKDILEFRQTSKLLATYIEPFLKGTGKHIYADGKIHPNFNQFLTATGRLSSDEPNGQNFPKHEGKGYIRNIIRAPKNHLIVAIDFGQIEYRVFGMASHDRAICEGLWKGYDVHGDWARRISTEHPYVLEKYEKQAQGDDSKLFKLFRQDVKNKWTFPLLFGSQLAPIALALEMREAHLVKLHTEFWHMFSGVKKWQEKMLSFYDKHGYVETLSGKRRHGPLELTQIINTPIQGTAAEIVTTAMAELSLEAYLSRKHSLQPIMNIHDDLTFYFPEAELDSYIESACAIMCCPKLDFINVPITVEVSVGSHWGELKEWCVVSSTDFAD